MRAMICRQWGGPEDLRLEEVAPAPLKAGQVRIKIRAAGVSFATTLVIAGKYQRRPPFPFAPGTEVSGVVTEVDAACKRLKVGDEVVAKKSTMGFPSDEDALAAVKRAVAHG